MQPGEDSFKKDISVSKHSETKPSRLPVWGDSLVNKLPGITRKRRKREASKKRREALRKSQERDE